MSEYGEDRLPEQAKPLGYSTLKPLFNNVPGVV